MSEIDLKCIIPINWHRVPGCSV